MYKLNRMAHWKQVRVCRMENKLSRLVLEINHSSEMLNNPIIVISPAVGKCRIIRVVKQRNMKEAKLVHIPKSKS